MRRADDSEQVGAALRGDREALTGLIRKYQRAVHAVALQHVGSAADAEEITQDVFVGAHGKLGQLKDPARFAGWLRTITVQRCRMWLRAERRRRGRAPRVEPLAGDDGLAGEPGQRFDGVFRIDELIAALPQRLRAAAILCLVNELSPAEASAVLGVKPGTLRKRLHEARARLQRQIVEKAEKELLLHLLPRDFAERCACRCAKAQAAKPGKDRKKQHRKEVMTMTRKSNCGCGCTANSKRKAKSPRKTKPSDKVTK